MLILSVLSYCRKAEVVCSNGAKLAADVVVVTASLGVLQSKSIAFNPPLPLEHSEAISAMGMGNRGGGREGEGVGRRWFVCVFVATF